MDFYLEMEGSQLQICVAELDEGFLEICLANVPLLLVNASEVVQCRLKPLQIRFRVSVPVASERAEKLQQLLAVSTTALMIRTSGIHHSQKWWLR